MASRGPGITLVAVVEGQRTAWAFRDADSNEIRSGEVSGAFRAILGSFLDLVHLGAFVSIGRDSNVSGEDGSLLGKLCRIADAKGRRIRLVRLCEVVSFAGEPAKRLLASVSTDLSRPPCGAGIEVRIAEWTVALIQANYERTWLRPDRKAAGPSYYSGRIKDGSHLIAEVAELEKAGWRPASGPAVICRLASDGPDIFVVGGRRKDELRNLTRAAKAVFRTQEDFLLLGPENLVPLSKREIAHTIGLHESVFSRLTSGRLVQTPFGVFQFAFFFGSGVPAGHGRTIATSSLRLRIARILQEHGEWREMTDTQIRTRLWADGLEVGESAVKKIRPALMA